LNGAVRIVAAASGSTEDEAARLLRESGQSAKTAIVMGLCGVGRDEAETLLERTNGHVRRAAELGKQQG
jgi:N-acetylmuramic acid 6-phosphate etherase